MKFGLIGSRAAAVDLVRAALNHPAHELVAACRAGDVGVQLQQDYPSVRVLDDWEELLDDGLVGAVIVGLRREQPETMDVLRKLVSAGIPVLVTHPAVSAIEAYEIEMIRASTRSPVQIYFDHAEHAMVDRLAKLALDPSFDAQQLTVERVNMAQDAASVLDALAQDAYWIAKIAGRIDRVNAVGGGQATEPLANLGVTLSGSQPLVSRWSVMPGRAAHAATLVLAGSQGKITVTVPQSGTEPWTWSSTLDQPFDEHPEDASHHGAREAIEQLVQAVETRTMESPWPNICRCLDVADSAELSARRGRTIELVQEAPTEESSFKGIMAAAGCAVLVGCLLFLFIGSLVEGFRLPMDPEAIPNAEPRSRLPLLIRLWPVYPLVAFLALQLLRLAARRSGAELKKSA